MKRVFLYVRVSTEEQAIHGLSIEAQTAALEEWARVNGHKVMGTYTDAGISARKPASKRPALQRLLADVQAKKGELIVFTKLDRWFRNIAEYYKVQEVLERCHVDWRTIHEDYDTSTASGRLKINIMLSVAQDEADRTSERIKAIMEVKRNKLEPLTGSCPPGYIIDGKRFIKDPVKEKAITAFFQKYMACGSLVRTFDYVQENFGLSLSYQNAHRMLSNPCYYGRYFGVDGMTPSYITKEEYDKIQTMRRHIVRKTEKNRTYIFSGLTFCGECGSRMGGRVNTNQESYYYNCTSHYMTGSGCDNNANLGERRIEAFLLETLRDKMEQWKVEAAKLYEQQQTRDYKNEIAALRTKLGKLKDLYLNDLITLEEYKTDQASYNSKIEALSAEGSAQKKPDFEMADKLLADGWEIAYHGMSQEQKQEFWRILIKQIRIYKDRHIEYDLNE